MSREGSLEASHRNNVRLVDHRLVKSQQGNVILECDWVERLVFYLPPGMLRGCTPRERSCSGSHGLRGAASRFGLSRSTLPNGPETEKIFGVKWVE